MASINIRKVNGIDYVYILSERIRNKSGGNSHYIGRKDKYSKIQINRILERFNKMEQEHKSRIFLNDLRNNQTDITISFIVTEIQEPVERFKNGKKLRVANATITDVIQQPEQETVVYQLALWGDKEINAVKPDKRYTLINGICKHYLSQTDGKLYVTLSKGKYGVLNG